MINNVLKVYDEDLASGDLSKGSIGGEKPVCVGTTNGALCVNVFAQGDVVLTDKVSISVKHSDSKEGGYAELFTIEIEGGENYKDGSLMASWTISQDAKAFMLADVTSSSQNSGSIRVTLGYLAR